MDASLPFVQMKDAILLLFLAQQELKHFCARPCFSTMYGWLVALGQIWQVYQDQVS